MRPATPLFIYALVALSLALAGCAPSHFVRNDAEARISEIRTIGIVPPDIRLFHLSSDGAARLEDLSDAARAHSSKAMKEFLEEAGFTVKYIEPDLRHGIELAEAKALSRAVHRSMQEFWNPVDYTYEYSMGRIGHLADYYGVDAFVFMDGSEAVFTEDVPFRRTVAAMTIGALYGPWASPRHNRSRACISLVEHSGAVVWAGFRDDIVHIKDSFQDPEKTRRLVRKLLSGMPL